MLLWVSRDIAAQRLEARGATDIEHRLAAYDEEIMDLKSPDAVNDYDLVIRTDRLSPSAVAAQILCNLEEPRRGHEVASAIAEITQQ